MLAWGQLVADLEKQGRRMPAIDSLIAATCLQERLDLVTRNERDFAHSGLTVVNPWDQW
jgi:tRNA(fMet)-specific endonuclease VapC